MKSDLQHLVRTWQDLGEHDPLWAVSTVPGKRRGRWDLTEFMETGERDVSHYHQLLVRHLNDVRPFSHVLDFGCGVGRLTHAWSKRAVQVTGVDISAPMLQVAKRNLAESTNVSFVLNQKNNLSIFPDGSFDLVFSLICLQHVPWPIASDYIREFARVCRDGGIVAFQLPSREIHLDRLAKNRKWVVEHLPFGLGRVYRRWRHGTSEIFEMYYTPCQRVETTAAAAGMDLVHREPDTAAGVRVESFFYIFRKPQSNSR